MFTEETRDQRRGTFTAHDSTGNAYTIHIIMRQIYSKRVHDPCWIDGGPPRLETDDGDHVDTGDSPGEYTITRKWDGVTIKVTGPPLPPAQSKK